MTDIIDADGNVKLLFKIFRDLQANGLGTVPNFFDVPADWRCPCCFRSKAEFARLDKSGNLLCSIHWHHDHAIDAYTKHMQGDPGAWAALVQSCLRFPRTLICNDCNTVEGNVKNEINAPEDFSFAPYEIASFISVRPNAAHVADRALADRAYAAAQPAKDLIRPRLHEILAAAGVEDIEPFISLKTAVGAVVKRLDLRIKKRN